MYIYVWDALSKNGAVSARLWLIWLDEQRSCPCWFRLKFAGGGGSDGFAQAGMGRVYPGFWCASPWARMGQV